MHGQRADLILDLDATVFQVMAQTRQVVFGVAYSDPTAPPILESTDPPIPAH
ncbi:MAG: hypothetical protein ACI974_002003 [Paraglaciecola sp.]|jgi:hypothetical protein